MPRPYFHFPSASNRVDKQSIKKLLAFRSPHNIARAVCDDFGDSMMENKATITSDCQFSHWIQDEKWFLTKVAV
jgi:hypothetical protein